MLFGHEAIILVTHICPKSYDAITSSPSVDFFELTQRLGGYCRGSLSEVPYTSV
jgi:hypothetical protein